MRFAKVVLTIGLLIANCSPSSPRYEDRCSPVTLLASFYDAVNLKEYQRAYRYWETRPGSLDDFARGYANTASVQLIVQPPMHISGAAGSLYAEIPTMLVARERDGRERLFVGCYVTRKSNLHPADIPKEEVWHIYKANMSPVRLMPQHLNCWLERTATDRANKGEEN